MSRANDGLLKRTGHEMLEPLALWEGQQSPGMRKQNPRLERFPRTRDLRHRLRRKQPHRQMEIEESNQHRASYLLSQTRAAISRKLFLPSSVGI